MKIIDLFRQPETRCIEDLDDPVTTLLHAKIIQKKPFLKNIYIDFYKQFKKVGLDLPTSGRGVLRRTPYGEGTPCEKILVELGSGGGFIKEVIPNVITSDTLELPNVDRIFSVFDMPFEQGSVDAFFMLDVLHHITNPRAFFKEALRCLKSGGKIVMIEPANTLWSRFIYKNFHHELFDTQAQWELAEIGPLSHGNGALAWTIFSRDREIFEQEFPSLTIVNMRNHTPLRYLLSGGLSLRQLVPPFTYPAVKAVEYLLFPLNNLLGMFQTIELQKQ